jgi:hypothetical protein
MATCKFKIISEGTEFNFTVETDDNNNLKELTATDGTVNYKCKLLLMPQPSSAGEAKCCTPDGCMSGPCFPD